MEIPSVKLEDLTHQEAKEYLINKDVIIIATGAIEQHGPHLPLTTDILIAEGIAERVAKKCEVLWCSPVRCGNSIHPSVTGLYYPGCISLSPQVFMMVLHDVAKSLVNQGFKRLIFLACHGGNVAPGQLALYRRQRGSLTYENQEAKIAMVQPHALVNLPKDFGIDDNGGHACAYETSLILYLHPELVKMDRAHDGVRQESEARKTGLLYMGMPVWYKKTPTSDVLGKPSLASKELGEKIMNSIVEKISKFIRGG